MTTMRSGEQRPWIVGISGASGAIYGVRLVEWLISNGRTVHLVITDAGKRVLNDELGWPPARNTETYRARFPASPGRLILHPIQDVGAAIASGSYITAGMVIAPCSMGSLASIAGGVSGNLLLRAADVTLKERRKLILVPRETPLSAIHLENMLKLARLGVTVLPAMPAFYLKPRTIEDLVNFQVGKILDAMGIDNDIYDRWGGD
jgi:4-hydroxy-3-polyprenylbenzoate decarboxylase